MVKKTELLRAVIVVLAQSLAACSSDEGERVARPADRAQRAQPNRDAPQEDQVQQIEGDGFSPPADQPQPPKQERGAPVRKPGVTARGQDFYPGRLSFADYEGWSVDAFFTAENELQICDVISSGDHERLEALLEAGVELNTPGKFGFNVLHWAYVEDDYEAYGLLLEHGADPDHRLTDAFRWSKEGLVQTPNVRGQRYYQTFLDGNSILFTSLLQSRPEYCIAALKYSKNVNQLDRGENLLHRFLHGAAYQRGLRAMIKAGVNLNAKGQNGETPAHLALRIDPSMCLDLLKAGADPSIKNDWGFDVAEELERKLSSMREWQKPEVYDPLIEWFRQNGRDVRPAEPKTVQSKFR